MLKVVLKITTYLFRVVLMLVMGNRGLCLNVVFTLDVGKVSLSENLGIIGNNIVKYIHILLFSFEVTMIHVLGFYS